MSKSEQDRPLRADAERTVRTILEVAERVLSEDPTASLGQIATAAGVARTTIHRRFSSREALIDAMAGFAYRQVADAIEAGRPQTAPPLVALHQITANVVQIKSAWRFTIGDQVPAAPEAAAVREGIFDACLKLLDRAQQAGVLRADIDLIWARRVYHLLLEQAAEELAVRGGDPDAFAETVVNTLLHGLGQPS
ncbi:TetR/AcrR family transcriptional regulator [Streptomyces sp. NPDC018059]|uniref:TetR/AcrR family transcriptional regulator n=1 Tax=Streptomyces TaxID=1883 RepID=UPI0037892084